MKMQEKFRILGCREACAVVFDVLPILPCFTWKAGGKQTKRSSYRHSLQLQGLIVEDLKFRFHGSLCLTSLG